MTGFATGQMTGFAAISGELVRYSVSLYNKCVGVGGIVVLLKLKAVVSCIITFGLHK